MKAKNKIIDLKKRATVKDKLESLKILKKEFLWVIWFLNNLYIEQFKIVFILLAL